MAARFPFGTSRLFGLAVWALALLLAAPAAFSTGSAPAEVAEEATSATMLRALREAVARAFGEGLRTYVRSGVGETLAWRADRELAWAFGEGACAARVAVGARDCARPVAAAGAQHLP